MPRKLSEHDRLGIQAGLNKRISESLRKLWHTDVKVRQQDDDEEKGYFTIITEIVSKPHQSQYWGYMMKAEIILTSDIDYYLDPLASNILSELKAVMQPVTAKHLAIVAGRLKSELITVNILSVQDGVCTIKTPDGEITDVPTSALRLPD